jgi:arylsulfatase A-like enzyme
LEAPEEVIAKYRHIKNPRRRIYAAMIDVMDQGIGMVVDALKETGAFENTLIFFLSDNGGVVLGKGWKKTADYANHGPLRGGKGTLYDGGSRVPFFAHWPAKLPKGKVYDGLTSSLDIAATAIAIGHGDLSGKKLDGVNLMPYLTKSKKGSPHEAVYWREGDGSGWAVRTQEYKYLKLNGSTDSPEMYALQEDPSESENIVGDLPEKQAELASKWNEWNKLNVSTLLLSSGSYQKARLKFYEEMFLRRKEASAKKKLLMIK